MAVKRYQQPVIQTVPGPEFKIEDVPLFESVTGKYVLATDYDAISAKLAIEIANKREFERDWLAACDQVSSFSAKLEQAKGWMRHGGDCGVLDYWSAPRDERKCSCGLTAFLASL